jgi:RNA polymerase sigma-70 factor (ECF subfamily)
MTNDYLNGGVTQRDSDIALAAALARNDDNAVNTFFTEFVNPVTRYVVHVVSDIGESDLEDVVQETFIGVLRAMPEYRGDCSLSTFVMRIAHHKAIDAFRRRQVVEKHEGNLTTITGEEPDILDANSNVEESIISQQRVAAVRKVLAELTEDQRQAITLRYIIGMRVEDVADTMKLTRRMVELLITKGRSAIRDKLSGLDL